MDELGDDDDDGDDDDVVLPTPVVVKRMKKKEEVGRKKKAKLYNNDDEDHHLFVNNNNNFNNKNNNNQMNSLKEKADKTNKVKDSKSDLKKEIKLKNEPTNDRAENNKNINEEDPTFDMTDVGFDDDEDLINCSTIDQLPKIEDEEEEDDEAIERKNEDEIMTNGDDDDGGMKVYWLDAYEDQYKQPGIYDF